MELRSKEDYSLGSLEQHNHCSVSPSSCRRVDHWSFVSRRAAHRGIAVTLSLESRQNYIGLVGETSFGDQAAAVLSSSNISHQSIIVTRGRLNVGLLGRRFRDRYKHRPVGLPKYKFRSRCITVVRRDCWSFRGRRNSKIMGSPKCLSGRAHCKVYFGITGEERLLKLPHHDALRAITSALPPLGSLNILHSLGS